MMDTADNLPLMALAVVAFAVLVFWIASRRQRRR